MKTNNLWKYYNLLIIITQLTSLSSRHSWLLRKWFTCKHGGFPSSRAEFFTSTSLSKGFDNSLSVLQFLVDISEKTKANDLALERLSNILNPYVIFRFFQPWSCFAFVIYQNHTRWYLYWSRLFRASLRVLQTTTVIKISLKTAALSLTWNTEVRIPPICYSNL